ncbi:hypothetical protein ACOSQ4_033203 [Xanthoceras sorbifolium]
MVPVTQKVMGCVVKWVPPPFDYFKVNVDASLRSPDSLVGVGAVVRNYLGQFMVGLSRKLVGNVSVEIAEATTILNGLHLPIESSFNNLILESDSLNVINYILSGTPPLSEVSLIVADILLLSTSSNVLFCFVPRSANCVAHFLAKNSFSIDNIYIWLEDYSPLLDQGLLSDYHA